MIPSRIRQFWEWFAQRSGVVKADPQKFSEEIADMVRRIDPGLGWEMGGIQDGPMDFVIRSEDPSMRYLAHAVVEAAPPMAGWTFSPWRGAMGPDIEIRVSDGKPFPVGQVTVNLEPHPDFPLLNATVIAPAFSKLKDDDRLEPGYLSLDCLLGEKLVEDAFDSIQFRGGKAGKVKAPDMRREVTLALEEARSRPFPSSEKWLSLKAQTSKGPLIAVAAEAPDVGLMSTHPWSIRVGVKLKSPEENGLPTKDELNEMRPFEGEVDHLLLDSTLRHVATASFLGDRSYFFYHDLVDDMPDRLRATAKRHALDCQVTVSYDSRWRAFRQFAPAK